MPKRAPVKTLETANESPEPDRHSGGAGPIEPYRPSARDLAWYQEWAVRHRSISEIATGLDVSYHTVHRVVRRVDPRYSGETMPSPIA